jgi:hypothetical protein
MRIEFPEINPELWIELRDMKTLSWKERKTIQAVALKESELSGINMIEKYIISLATSGNILNSNNQPISFPLSQDGLEQIPGFIIEKLGFIVGEITKQEQEGIRKNLPPELTIS